LAIPSIRRKKSWKANENMAGADFGAGMDQ
jgi:hypothetical protein